MDQHFVSFVVVVGFPNGTEQTFHECGTRAEAEDRRELLQARMPDSNVVVRRERHTITNERPF